MNGYETEHAGFLRRFGAECTVLLKADGSFPLDSPCELALYGSGARCTVKGGTGSGEVNSRTSVSVEEGLEAAGFRISSKNWLDRYGEIWPKAKKRFVRNLKWSALKRGTLAILDSMGAVMPEPEYDLPLDASGDAAIYVLSRISGEGSDRKPIPGDILLTETEKRDILELERKFSRFMLVLNVGGVIDLSPVMEVRNILLLSQLGCETGNILADIILGRSTPSGKLASTWFSWADHPSVGSFGDRYDTHYTEGIYVGYRYFDTVAKDPLFPFGYGLSYTCFEVETGRAAEESGQISVDVTVKNIGTRNGKETVQLYVSQPGGKLDKAWQVLAAFDKTDDLKPGKIQGLTLSFDLRSLASYDAERAAWILESGDYVLRLGTSSRSTKAVCVIRLNSEAVIRQFRNCLGNPDISDWNPESRAEEENNMLPVISVNASAFTTEIMEYPVSEKVDPLIESLSDEELCLINIGAFKRKGSESVIGNAGQSVAGSAGETVNCLKPKGIPALVMADGPAGLRLSRQYTRDDSGVHGIGSDMPGSVLELMPAPAAFFMKHFSGTRKIKGEIFEQNCTAIPIGTALAQSWNLRFAEQCGDLVGDEMERFGVHLWLAPALNIHRDIRCGRNYEYYSEDPLLSGHFAAAVIRGVQKHPGCGTTIKHFAANNQETNRYGSNSIVSERAMREIYLRGFEIAVQESRPHALMTSYNLLNGIHTSERRDLIEDILRAEFGFKGIVITDWIVAALNSGKKKYPAPNIAGIAAAGGDLIMPGSPDDLKAMLKGLKDGTVTRRQLMINGTRVYRLARKLTEERGGMK
ncbi:MAG: glycoside hydrolase family 3 C-terminal domain-containing protein [Clostridia bacterium]|nr:glycoside hydrolase family 3 C-terminal domain-containing protein [Clostridia bacterium]